jgi:hypothetical protein
MKSLAAGIERDRAAVVAALARTPASSSGAAFLAGAIVKNKA